MDHRMGIILRCHLDNLEGVLDEARKIAKAIHRLLSTELPALDADQQIPFGEQQPPNANQA
jgi:hypothetical protein